MTNYVQIPQSLKIVLIIGVPMMDLSLYFIHLIDGFWFNYIISHPRSPNLSENYYQFKKLWCHYKTGKTIKLICFITFHFVSCGSTVECLLYFTVCVLTVCLNSCLSLSLEHWRIMFYGQVDVNIELNLVLCSAAGSCVFTYSHASVEV